jgi:hypothetical protein
MPYCGQARSILTTLCSLLNGCHPPPAGERVLAGSTAELPLTASPYLLAKEGPEFLKA